MTYDSVRVSNIDQIGASLVSDPAYSMEGLARSAMETGWVLQPTPSLLSFLRSVEDREHAGL